MCLRKRPLSGNVATGAVLLVLLLACSEPASSAADASASPQVGKDASNGGLPEGGGAPGARQDAAALDESAFSPEGLPNLPLDSVAGVLTLFASTLKPGANGLELYAAIRNDGAYPLCGAAMMIEFYDHADQLMGTASAGVQSGRLYRIPDGSGTISCVAPGQTAMAAATSLPQGLELEALKYLGHRFPAFQIDGAELLPSATVSEVEAYATAEGTVYRGTVLNAADAPISDPNVSVFPVNGVGRPLGVATSKGTVEIAPADTWSFETSAIAEPGVDHVAFATATSASN
jgi:hypothetical protein